MALGGGIGVILGASMTWLVSGRTERSAFDLIRTANNLGVLDTTFRRVAVSSLLIVPITTPLTLLFLSLGRRRLAGLSSSVGSLVGVACGAVALQISSISRSGPMVTVSAGAVGLLGGLMLLFATTFHDRPSGDN